ncbi:hypothetical protein LCGC14_2600210, partial [marine sediment metagenome]
HLSPSFRWQRRLDDDVIPRPVAPNEFVGVWGQRSGKSLMVGTFVFPYILHRYLALPSVTRYFDEPENKILDAVFVAPILKQASDFMWEPFKHAYHTSPWFTEVVAHIKDRERRIGVQLYREQQTYIAFVGKRLACHMAAANAGTLRGGTRFFCVTGETLIQTDKGWFRADMMDGVMADGPLQAFTYDKGLQNITKSLSHKAKIRKIVTEHGYELRGSNDHPILILNPETIELEYRTLADIQSGDQVCLSTAPNFAASPAQLPVVLTQGSYQKYHAPDVMTPDLAYLSGILIADGCLRREGPRRHTSDMEILDKSTQAFERVFKKAPKIIFYEALKEEWSPGWYVDVQSNIVGRFLDGIGVRGKSADKEIPWSILQSDMECMRQFLAGYFDGVGHVDKDHICAHSKSAELLRQVQAALLTLGIVSRRSSEYERFTKGKMRSYSQLKIFGSNIILFHERIPLTARKR